MSVLIKGFEMPKDGCKDCAMVKRGKIFDTCPFLKQEVNGNVERGGKPNGCPLIDVPDTNVGDTISRQAAIDAIDNENPCVAWLDYAVDIIKALPPARPERKKGKWNCSDDMFEYAICSACKWDSGEAWEYAKKRFRYCPNCGSDNREEADNG